MKLTAKVDIRRLKLKMIRWMKSCREDEKASLQEFSRAFVQTALKFTPPGDGKMSVGKAHKALKERIEEDFLGYGDTAELDASHFGWYRDPWGRRYARVLGKDVAREKQGRVSPFYAFKGRPSRQLREAMGVGKYRVEITYAYDDYTFASESVFNISYSPEYDAFVTFDSAELHNAVRDRGTVSEGSVPALENDPDRLDTYSVYFTVPLLIAAAVLYIVDIIVRKITKNDIKSLFRFKKRA